MQRGLVSVSDVRAMMMIMTVMIVILGVMMTLCHAGIIRSHSNMRSDNDNQVTLYTILQKVSTL